MKCDKNITLYLFIVLALSTSGCQTINRILHIDSGSLEISRDDLYLEVGFSDHDRRMIREYYGHKGKKKKMPPGLAKRDTLPPGLQKRLDSGHPLPPGLQGRDLPYDLEEDLTELPRGYVRLRVGGDIIIMNRKTDVVIDIIHDI